MCKCARICIYPLVILPQGPKLAFPLGQSPRPPARTAESVRASRAARLSLRLFARRSHRPARCAMDLLLELDAQTAAADAWLLPVPMAAAPRGQRAPHSVAQAAGPADAEPEVGVRRVGTGLPARCRRVPGRDPAASRRFADAGSGYGCLLRRAGLAPVVPPRAPFGWASAAAALGLCVAFICEGVFRGPFSLTWLLCINTTFWPPSIYIPTRTRCRGTQGVQGTR